MRDHATVVRFPAPATSNPAPAEPDPITVLDRWAAVTSRRPEWNGAIRLLGVVHDDPYDADGSEILTSPVVAFDPIAFLAETSDGGRYLLDRQRECGLPLDVALFFVRVDRP